MVFRLKGEVYKNVGGKEGYELGGGRFGTERDKAETARKRKVWGLD